MIFLSRNRAKWAKIATVATAIALDHQTASCFVFFRRIAKSARTCKDDPTQRLHYMSLIGVRHASTQEGSSNETIITTRESWTKLPRLYIGPAPTPRVISADMPLNESFESESISAALSPDAMGKDVLVPLSEEQSHYLTTVLRLKKKSKSLPMARLFNNKEEWVVEIMTTALGRSRAAKSDPLFARCVEKVRSDVPFKHSFWIVVAAPKKKDRTRYLVEKCTELGATGFVFLATEFSESPERLSKLLAYAVEASEQCERLDIPSFVSVGADISGKSRKHQELELTKLTTFLKAWTADSSRFPLMVCRERAGTVTPSALQVLLSMENQSCTTACLIGPEGGWSPSEENEFNMIEKKFPSQFYNVALGPNILRTETAAAAATTIFGLAQRNYS